MSLPTVRRIVSEEERQAVVAAAMADSDNMHFPTHVVLKNNEIAGGWCLAGVPLVMMWNDSKRINARESLVLNNMVGAMMNDRGARTYFIACNDSSPYIGYMEKFGYRPVWPTNIFYRKV